MPTCAENECVADAAVRIHDPRGPDRNVCTSHARVLVQQDGVVAVPLDDVEEWQ